MSQKELHRTSCKVHCDSLRERVTVVETLWLLNPEAILRLPCLSSLPAGHQPPTIESEMQKADSSCFCFKGMGLFCSSASRTCREAYWGLLGRFVCLKETHRGKFLSCFSVWLWEDMRIHTWGWWSGAMPRIWAPSSITELLNRLALHLGPLSSWQGNVFSLLKPLLRRYLKKIHIYLAASVLSCSMQDLHCIIGDLRCGADSLVLGCGLLSMWVQCLRHSGLVALRHMGSYFPNQGSNLHPLHCKADS